MEEAGRVAVAIRFMAWSRSRGRVVLVGRSTPAATSGAGGRAAQALGRTRREVLRILFAGTRPSACCRAHRVLLYGGAGWALTRFRRGAIPDSRVPILALPRGSSRDTASGWTSRECSPSGMETLRADA